MPAMATRIIITLLLLQHYHLSIPMILIGIPTPLSVYTDTIVRILPRTIS